VNIKVYPDTDAATPNNNLLVNMDKAIRE